MVFSCWTGLYELGILAGLLLHGQGAVVCVVCFREVYNRGLCFRLSLRFSFLGGFGLSLPDRKLVRNHLKFWLRLIYIPDPIDPFVR